MSTNCLHIHPKTTSRRYAADENARAHTSINTCSLTLVMLNRKVFLWSVECVFSLYLSQQSHTCIRKRGASFRIHKYAPPSPLDTSTNRIFFLRTLQIIHRRPKRNSSKGVAAPEEFYARKLDVRIVRFIFVAIK